MATRRVTFEKQQRERAKKEKAALKRERRQERKLEKELGIGPDEQVDSDLDLEPGIPDPFPPTD